MNRNIKRLAVGSLMVSAMLLSGCTAMKVMMQRPFGSSKDVAYGNALWKQLEAKGYNSTKSVLFDGSLPHGTILEVVEGKIDGKTVVVKRNYRGEDITIDKVKNDRAKYLKAITVMAKREDGYDPQNQNWFYARYNADGSYYKKMGMLPLVGRVGKGMGEGAVTCISCHRSAPDGDFRFVKDNDSRVTHI